MYIGLETQRTDRLRHRRTEMVYQYRAVHAGPCAIKIILLHTIDNDRNEVNLRACCLANECLYKCKVGEWRLHWLAVLLPFVCVLLFTYLTRGFVFHPSNTFSGCSGVARTRHQMDHTQTDRQIQTRVVNYSLSGSRCSAADVSLLRMLLSVLSSALSACLSTVSLHCPGPVYRIHSALRMY